MSIKRYVPDADTTIVNAYQANLTVRGTGSNMGLADVLEVFSIYGQASSSSKELARSLISFPITSIITDRAAETIPASGSVSFYLRLFNARHSQTLPSNFTIIIAPIGQSWEEGYGKDLDEYTDLTKDDVGANWINASSGTAWTTSGGVFDLTLTGSYTFSDGTEDLEVDVSDVVEQWIAGSRSNNGLGVFLSASHESASTSFYTKKFFSRGSEFFHKRPLLEARWDSTIKDNRGQFFASSSLVDAADNTNNIYMYNVVHGQLKDIANVGTNPIMVRLHDAVATGNVALTTVTGGWVQTGIYSASIIFATTASLLYDVWYSGSEDYHTGTVSVNTRAGQNYNLNSDYVINLTNLKAGYSRDETVRLRLYIRDKNWKPTIYVKATSAIETTPIEKVYFKIFRTIDNLDIISYGTGSTKHTQLSYDVSGNYFDLDMDLLEQGYSYGIKFIFNLSGRYDEQKETFKFRILDDE